MSLRYRIIFAIMVCAMVSVAMATIPLFLGARKLAGEAAERSLTQFEAQVQEALDSRVNAALSMAEIVAAIPRVQRAVEKADTKGLHRLFVKDFEEFARKTGVVHFEFHTPDAVSILPVHAPDQYGDDLSGSRPLVVAANRDHASMAGVQRDAAGLGFRGIAPVRDDGEHLGTVEFGLPLDAAFLTELVTGTHHAIELYFLPDGTADEATRLTVQYSGPPLMDRGALDAVLGGATPIRALTIDGAPFGSKGFVVRDFAGQPVAVANVILSEARAQAISDSMIQRTVLGAGGALALSMILAWIFGRNLTAKLQGLITRMKRLAEGELRLNLTGMDHEKAEIGEMVRHLRVFRDGIDETNRLRDEQGRSQAAQAHVVDALARGLRKLSHGDLDAKIDGTFEPAYTPLIDDYNTAVAQLTEVIAAISTTAQAVTTSAAEISQSSENLSTRTENSAATLEQTAAALQQVTTAIEDSSTGARAADGSGQDAIRKARAGADIVAETVKAMTEIDNSAGEIARISDMIDDIAFQTNLLALNAGVEAARAGHAGSGFAVVATEVRSLAQRTTEAARQIGTLIATSGERVQHGVALVGQTGGSLSEILQAVEDVTDQIRRIAELSAEQAQGLGEVNVAVRHLDQVTQENAGMFEQASAASAALRAEGARLSDLVGRFRLPDHEAAMPEHRSAV